MPWGGDVHDGDDLDTSVAGIAEHRWGVRPQPVVERFTEPGWTYIEVVATQCPACGGLLRALRKPYEPGGRRNQHTALVCPMCPASFTLADLGVKRYDQLHNRPTRSAAEVQEVPVNREAGSDAGVPATVADVAEARWGVRPEPAAERFTVPGWWYEESTAVPCPRCAGELHALRKLYDGPNRKPDEPTFLVAVVCPSCPATFTLRDLGQRSYKALMGEEPVKKESRPRRLGIRRPDAAVESAATSLSKASATEPRWLDCDVPPGEMRIRPITIPADRVHEYVEELLSPRHAPAMFDRDRVSPREPEVVEKRLLHWRKITDPAAPVSPPPAGVDVRVLLPLAPEFADLCARLAAAGVPYRQVRYWLEAETVSTVGDHGGLVPLRATADLAVVTNAAKHRTAPATGPAAAAARDAFEMMWDTHLEPHDTSWEPVPAAGMVPEAWLPYLPHSTLNPAQAQAAPIVLGGSGHMVVTAPTGSGKTVIGMLAVLKAILGEERKAAWLVPQRSLTDELDRELAVWRRLGLRVEPLSGEYATDVAKVREAGLWVATTEKFEAICRASSLRAALAEVSCLVVDEIHLLGDAVRGPLLEALLARVRGEESPVRIVGLSATAANADQVADWLGATPVHTTWRPSRLTWQLPMVPASSDRKVKQETRSRLATEITAMIARDGGSVLVFCGSKRNVRSTALAIAATHGANTRGVNVDDLVRVHQICTSVGIGLHYKDWEHKREAEQGFRDRTLDVLVATTTVAAGVNLIWSSEAFSQLKGTVGCKPHEAKRHAPMRCGGPAGWEPASLGTIDPSPCSDARVQLA
jgi:helicase